MNVTPPDAPTPGMDGGAKASPVPWGSLPSSRLRCAMMAGAFSSEAFRSDQGFNRIKKNAL